LFRFFPGGQPDSVVPEQQLICEGIITKFILKTYPLGLVWGGIKRYTNQDFPAIMCAYYEYQAAAEQDPYSELIILTSPTNDTVGVWLSMIYLKPKVDPAVFAPFYGINTTSDTTGIKSLTEYIGEYGIPEFTRQATSP
jgi:hypothetical protein